jgi:hypothetical protein
MNVSNLYRICWCLLLPFTLSCSDTAGSISARLAAAEHNAVKAVPFAQAFGDAFPKHQVAVCGVVSMKPYKREVQVQSSAYDRYLLYLVYVVEFRSERDVTVVGFNQPQFRIQEVIKVGTAENGNPLLDFGDTFQLTAVEFEKLRMAGFGLEATGIPLKTNAPVAGFATYAQESLRKDW